MKSLVTVLFKMTLHSCIYFAFTKNPIILSLFKIDILNDFDMPFKIYVIGLHDLISMNIFFTLKDHNFFFIVVKRQPKTNKLLNKRIIRSSRSQISKFRRYKFDIDSDIRLHIKIRNMHGKHRVGVSFQ